MFISKKSFWWARIAAKLFLSRLPFSYRFYQAMGLFRHGQMDESTYPIRVFEDRANQAGVLNSLRGKVILELGPGDSIATAVISRSLGAKGLLVDAGRFANENIQVYKELANELKKNGYLDPHISECQNIDQILIACDGQYLTGGLKSLKGIQSNSIDYIFSQAVLEHIREHEFLETLIQCNRILKSDGICCHRVDLRDHLGGGLNNLRINSKIWESHFFASSGFYTNRIRFGRMMDLFKVAGFKYSVTNLVKWESAQIKRNKLSSEFHNISNEDLLICEFDVLLSK